MVEGRYRPTRVTASGTTGIATSMGCDPRTEDTITLLVDWQNISDEKQRGTAVYTASWAAPLKAGVHSEQRFHYMAAKGEVRVDQAHRGYSVVEDETGKADVSPPLKHFPPFLAATLSDRLFTLLFALLSALLSALFFALFCSGITLISSTTPFMLNTRPMRTGSSMGSAVMDTSRSRSSSMPLPPSRTARPRRPTTMARAFPPLRERKCLKYASGVGSR